MLGEEEVFGEVGGLILKPRGQWHTLWNAGDTPARILEIISPGGFEEASREMHALGEDLNPTAMTEIGVRYGGEIDLTHDVDHRASWAGVLSLVSRLRAPVVASRPTTGCGGRRYAPLKPA